MAIYVGSARHDERGKYTGGKKGDQLQTKINDLTGEASMQPFYIHKKNWNVLRPISPKLSQDLAIAMVTACNNANIGYSQNCQRKTPDDIATEKPINVDCSKLIRNCIYFSTHNDVGNFTTANEVAVLEKSGLFQKHFKFKSLSKTPIYNGDVLVTVTKGHTVIVVDGSPRPTKTDVPKTYYPRYTGNTTSIVTALKSVGEKDTSFSHRKKIASANGITSYLGRASQNTSLLNKLKNGTLVKV